MTRNPGLGRRNFFLASTAGAFAAALAPPADAASTRARTIVVNARVPHGRVRSLQGTNSLPSPTMSPEAFKTYKRERKKHGRADDFIVPPRATDLASYMRAAQIDLVRIHDTYGVADVDSNIGSHAGASPDHARSIFPDMSADPSDERSYNFGPADAAIKRLRDTGIEILFRIGRSEGAEPPRDFDRYADVVRHIVRHYNDGWANGFRNAIKYWEVWNEPDVKKFWNGTPEAYHSLYVKVAAAVKSVDCRLKIGGPASAGVREDVAFTKSFLGSLRKTGAPLDFFSWHHYSTDANDPYNFSRIAFEVRQLLDEYEFRDTEIFVDEWNSDFWREGSTSLSEAGRASFITSAMLYMQDAPVDRACYYGDVTRGGDGENQIDMVGEAFRLLGQMVRTSHRLEVVGTHRSGLCAIAGRSEAERKIKLLVSNYEIPQAYRGPRPGGDTLGIGSATAVVALWNLLPRLQTDYVHGRGYVATIEGLDDSAAYTLETRSITDAGLTTRRERVRASNGTLTIVRANAAPTVEFFEITPDSSS